MDCKLCKERGKTWSGSEPICAFKDITKFESLNWNCETMNQLREIIDERKNHVWFDDQYYALLPFDDGLIYLSWYKQRGRTDIAKISKNDGKTWKNITHEDAIKCIEYYKRN